MFDPVLFNVVCRFDASLAEPVGTSGDPGKDRINATSKSTRWRLRACEIDDFEAKEIVGRLRRRNESLNRVTQRWIELRLDGFTTSLRNVLRYRPVIAVRCLTFRQDERFAPAAHSPDPEKDEVGGADSHSPTSSPGLGAKLRP